MSEGVVELPPPSAGLGARLREMRQRKGMSQEDLAGDALTAGYVSLIEAGKRNPTARTVGYLADRLGCTPLFLGEGIDPEADQEEQLQLAYAELALANGEAAEAETTFARLSRSARSSATRDKARWGVARALEAMGRLEQAIAAYERLVETHGDIDGEAVLTTVIALARCYREVGDFAHSIGLAENAMARTARLGLSGSDLEVQLACTLAAAYAERGDLARAAYLAQQTIDRAERAGTPRARGSAYWEASVIAHESGRNPEALEFADRALGLFGENNDDRNLARLHTAYATFLLGAGEPSVESARVHLNRAHDALRDSGSAVDLAYCETEMAKAHLLAGEAPQAVEVAREALTRLHGGERVERLRCQAVLLHALAAAGEADEARQLMAGLVGELELIGTGRHVAVLWREVGDAAKTAGNVELALRAYEHSLAVAGIHGTGGATVSARPLSLAASSGSDATGVHR
jgi:transcriptional regulator with XRE-family HTH domain